MYGEKNLPLHLGKKKLVFFIIIFLWEKITKKIQCHNKQWYGGYLLSKDQENTLACFRNNTNLKFVFLPHLTMYQLSIVCDYSMVEVDNWRMP